jgi:glycosyltransferase involved in cell wall biosynthesis
MKRSSEKDSRKNGPWFALRHFIAAKQVDLAERGLFDAAYYLANNPDVAAAGVDPYEHYIKYGKMEGRRGVPLNDDPHTSVVFGKSEIGNKIVANTDLDKVGQSRESFDADFYLDTYPDIAVSGMDPYEHYVAYGKQEGRIGARPKLKYSGSFDDLEPSRDTVLVVSHEASRTGAPILSLNIIRELKKKYNVISILLAGGSITADFQHASDIAVEPLPRMSGLPATASLVNQLLERQKVHFAIINSIESRKVLQTLAQNFVPAIVLIHEFAAYTRPRDAFREVALWSSDTVFSAPVIHLDAVTEYPDLCQSVSHILPQGRCSPATLPADDGDHSAEDARITRALRPHDAPDDLFVVLGAGAVQLRKGVDLFLECAARVLRSSPGRPVRFVWIGKGYDPERDMSYSVYLADQVRRAGLQEHVKFVGETSSIEAAYAAANLMLISSRLDPLPNVAIDAMAHGLPVVCFDRTTGIADVLKMNGLGDECVAAYLDSAEMADKTLAFIRSQALSKSVGERLQDIVSEQFDMAHYVNQLEALALGAKERVEQERADTGEIFRSSLSNLEFMTPPQLKDASRDQVIRDYVRSWASGIRQRKPFPGFQPGIYQECTRDKAGDPFANYLRAGQPEGPWRYEVIDPTEQKLVTPFPEGARIALHLHVYYPDLLPEILRRLTANQVRPDLLISVPSEDIKRETQSLLDDYDGRVVDLKVVPNRGRDIGPFLTAFGATLLDNYDIVGHLHTKKTKDVEDASMAEAWRSFILENLLGDSAHMADLILSRMIADPSIGMVCPDDPYVVRWGKNRPYAEGMAFKLGLHHLPEHFLFPLGTMFWARVEALRPSFELGLGWDDYPSEPLPYDGSVVHALERLLGLCAARYPFRLVATHVPGFKR